MINVVFMLSVTNYRVFFDFYKFIAEKSNMHQYKKWGKT